MRFNPETFTFTNAMRYTLYTELTKDKPVGDANRRFQPEAIDEATHRQISKEN